MAQHAERPLGAVFRGRRSLRPVIAVRPLQVSPHPISGPAFALGVGQVPAGRDSVGRRHDAHRRGDVPQRFRHPCGGGLADGVSVGPDRHVAARAAGPSRTCRRRRRRWARTPQRRARPAGAAQRRAWARPPPPARGGPDARPTDPGRTTAGAPPGPCNANLIPPVERRQYVSSTTRLRSAGGSNRRIKWSKAPVGLRTSATCAGRAPVQMAVRRRGAVLGTGSRGCQSWPRFGIRITSADVPRCRTGGGASRVRRRACTRPRPVRCRGWRHTVPPDRGHGLGPRNRPTSRYRG